MRAWVDASAHFFRTHTRVAPDLVLTVKGKTVAIDIKLGTAVPTFRTSRSA